MKIGQHPAFLALQTCVNAGALLQRNILTCSQTPKIEKIEEMPMCCLTKMKNYLIIRCFRGQKNGFH